RMLIRRKIADSYDKKPNTFMQTPQRHPERPHRTAFICAGCRHKRVEKRLLFRQILRAWLRRHSAPLDKPQISFLIGEIKGPSIAMKEVLERLIQARGHFVPRHRLGQASD